MRLVDVADDLWQRAVVADRTGQHEGDVLLHNAVHDAVFNVTVLDELRDRAAAPHEVEHVQMVVVAVGHRLLGVDVLAQRRVQQRALEIVRRQRVARHQAVGVAVFDEPLHREARVAVKGKGRAHHPQDVPTLTLGLQQLDQPVVVAGVGGLAAAALAEDELVPACGRALVEAVGVEKNALLAALRAAEDHAVAAAQVAVLHHRERAVIAQHDAGIHAALFSQLPFAVDLVVFRVHRGAVVALRRDAAALDDGPGGVRRVFQLRRGEVRRVVGRERKSHGKDLRRSYSACILLHSHPGIQDLLQNKTPRDGAFSVSALAAEGSDPVFLQIQHLAVLEVLFEIDLAAFLQRGVALAVLEHDVDDPAGDHDIQDLGRAVAARHGRDDLADVGVGEKMAEKGALIGLALVIGAVVQHADAGGDQEGQRHDGRHGDPHGKAGEEAVKVVPAALFLSDHHDHDDVDRRVDQHGDQRQQRIAQAQALLAHEKAERHDRKDRADAVQEEARAGEDQQKALDRREDEQ